MKRTIRAAEDTETTLKDSTDKLEDDFEYVIAGIEKLEEIGKEERAKEVIDTLQSYIDEITSDIASAIYTEVN